MSTPQTPDSMRRSQQEKTPPKKPEGDRPGKLSDDEAGDRAEERQGGH